MQLLQMQQQELEPLNSGPLKQWLRGGTQPPLGTQQKLQRVKKLQRNKGLPLHSKQKSSLTKRLNEM
jgi:hypothetical protein